MSSPAKGYFNRSVDTVQQRTEELSQDVQNAAWEQPHVVMRALEDLQSALAELHSAEAELHLQNQELIASQQAIETERQRYQELFEFAPDGYLITDRLGVIQEANQAAAALLNDSTAELIDQSLLDWVVDEQQQSFQALLSHLPTLQRVQEWEVQLHRRKQEPFEAALTVQTVLSQDGQPIALRWLVRDVTARKQAEAQLYQTQLQNMELQETARLKTQFMSTLSHELRTPMNAILGFSDLLLRRFHDQQDAQIINMVERILRNGRHLLLLIEEMLDFSKLRSHYLTLNVEPFNLVDLAIATLEELRPLAEQKSLQLQLEAPPELLVTNDRMRLRQILVNLLSNAIKFTETGSVTLQITQPTPDWLTLTVCDTGIGIDPADRPFIFREFWQANQSNSRKYGGTGLGLAIVQALAQLMQGDITVESQLGVGTQFHVNLPRQLDQMLQSNLHCP